MTRQNKTDVTPRKIFCPMALTYLGAMLASNHALQHVSYPTQVIGKSVKPIPIMILGVLIGRKSYSLRKYLFVMMIVIGVGLFMYNPKGTHDKGDSGNSSFIGFGEILLVRTRMKFYYSLYVSDFPALISIFCFIFSSSRLQWTDLPEVSRTDYVANIRQHRTR